MSRDFSKNRYGEELQFNRKEICCKCSKYKLVERYENLCRDCMLNLEIDDRYNEFEDSFGSKKK